MPIDNLEILLENAWSGREEGEFENDIRLRNAVTSYVEAAEALREKVKDTVVGTDDFWIQDAMDSFDRASAEVRRALGR